MKEEHKIAQGEIKSFLTFRLEKEQFAVNVTDVIEILVVPKITKVPRAPEYLVGVINLRGNVLPVIDTRIKFNMTPTILTEETCIVVMNIEIDEEEIVVGALVDAVYQVIDIEEKAIKASPSIGSDYNPEFIEGVIKIGEEFVMLLDIGKVFSSKEMTVLTEASNMNIKNETK